MENLEIENEFTNEEIRNLIYIVRGKQVMLDSDVAMLYHYETKKINQAVKRNIERFPEEFCFRLTEEDIDSLRSQIATLKNGGRGQHRKYLPYAFTEQGIAMLSGLLKNEIAIRVSINIMNAFVEMRKFLSNNAHFFERLTNVEYKLLEHDKKFDQIFNELQHEENIKQKIFFDGQIWDSYSVIVNIIKKAIERILIIDNYIDDTILELLTKKNKNVEVIIVTANNSKIFRNLTKNIRV